MIQIRRIDERDGNFHARLRQLSSVNMQMDPELTATVTSIINDIRERGDEALVEYTNRFDNRKISIDDLAIPLESLETASRDIPVEMLESLQYAAGRIKSYAEKQKIESWSYTDETGILLGQQVTAVEKAGIYVPGGRATYPSSVLMNAIPARVAGVDEIIMAVPAPAGELNPAVLAAAYIAGVDRVFSIGGAQAVAALAFGTETVPQVDKIVGPGNRFVAAAKRLVYGTVGIDMIAGPSEVLIVTDGSCDPDWIAMDMFAQAEHDEDAKAILVGADASHLDEVMESIRKLLPEMERAEIIRKSLENHGALILAAEPDSIASIINRIAPEHLQLPIQNPESLLPQIRNAGAIFLGNYTAESLGDYCVGPNHVLPTARSARFSSPLGVYDFQKRSSVIKCDKGSVATIAAAASVLARGEGLTAHARSAEYRKKA
ncbi:MAG: histidinol dehydrogenase [Gammaproteobacteria bacterium]